MYLNKCIIGVARHLSSRVAPSIRTALDLALVTKTSVLTATRPLHGENL